MLTSFLNSYFLFIVFFDNFLINLKTKNSKKNIYFKIYKNQVKNSTVTDSLFYFSIIISHITGKHLLKTSNLLYLHKKSIFLIENLVFYSFLKLKHSLNWKFELNFKLLRFLINEKLNNNFQKSIIFNLLKFNITTILSDY